MFYLPHKDEKQITLVRNKPNLFKERKRAWALHEYFRLRTAFSSSFKLSQVALPVFIVVLA